MKRRVAPSSLPGFIRQSILLRKKMDARVKPAHDGVRNLRRCEFIALLAAAAAWPLATRAQQGERMRRIGVISALAADDPEWRLWFAAFLAQLRESGWVNDRNLRIDARFAAGDAERMTTYASDLISQAPDAIFAVSNPALAALQQQTRTIPIVFVHVADPVGSGFVASLARPGGNATGFTNFEPAMGSKWLEVLREVAPGLTRAMVLLHAQTAANVAMSRAAEAAGSFLGIAESTAAVQTAADIEGAVTSFAREPNGGLIIMPHVVTARHRVLIAELALRHRLPAVAAFRFMAMSGCLMSYGIDSVDVFRRAAVYVDRVLRGEKPGDLPVQNPTRFELIINLKTANTLGLDIPPMLLARADEVIE
jgi:putative ABC transport system substrate-binding protein